MQIKSRWKKWQTEKRFEQFYWLIKPNTISKILFQFCLLSIHTIQWQISIEYSINGIKTAVINQLLLLKFRNWLWNKQKVTKVIKHFGWICYIRGKHRQSLIQFQKTQKNSQMESMIRYEKVNDEFDISERTTKRNPVYTGYMCMCVCACGRAYIYICVLLWMCLFVKLSEFQKSCMVNACVDSGQSRKKRREELTITWKTLEKYHDYPLKKRSGNEKKKTI